MAFTNHLLKMATYRRDNMQKLKELAESGLFDGELVMLFNVAYQALEELAKRNEDTVDFLGIKATGRAKDGRNYIYINSKLPEFTIVQARLQLNKGFPFEEEKIVRDRILIKFGLPFTTKSSKLN